MQRWERLGGTQADYECSQGRLPGGTSPTLRELAMLGWLRCKRSLVGCHPGLLWTTKRMISGYPEPELSLLPILCRRDGLAFVKVDTEGHEESVLLGGRETLARCRPALMVETEERHKPGAVAGVTRFLADLGYRRYFLHHGVLMPGEQLSLKKHHDRQRPRDYVRNLIFLQEAHVERLQRAAAILPFSIAGLGPAAT